MITFHLLPNHRLRLRNRARRRTKCKESKRLVFYCRLHNCFSPLLFCVNRRLALHVAQLIGETSRGYNGETKTNEAPRQQAEGDGSEKNAHLAEALPDRADCQSKTVGLVQNRKIGSPISPHEAVSFPCRPPVRKQCKSSMDFCLFGSFI